MDRGARLFTNATLAAIALSVALAGCRKSPSPDDQSAFVNVAIPAFGPQGSPSGVESGEGDLLITLVDQNGAHPRGIRVQVKGKVSSTFVSDERGQVLFHGPAGFYEVGVVSGCTDEFEVLEGNADRAGLLGGNTTEGELNVVWRHRLGPRGRTIFSPDQGRTWGKGEVIEVGFFIGDRCRDNATATDGSLRTFSFVPSENLRIVGEPTMEGDATGRILVNVACIGVGGFAQLFVFDQENPSDEEELFRLQSGPTPYCAGETTN